MACCCLAGLMGCATKPQNEHPPGATQSVVVVPTVAPVVSTAQPVAPSAPKSNVLGAVSCAEARGVGTIDEKTPLGGPAAMERPHPHTPGSKPQSGFHQVTDKAPAPRDRESTPLQLELTGPKQLAAGALVPLKLTFRNRGDTALVLVKPLDGSYERWRFPFYDLYAQDRATGAVYRYAFVGGRCGMVNAIGDEDYATLPPGATRDDLTKDWAEHLTSSTVPQKGRYRLWVVYSFCGFEGGKQTGSDHLNPEAHRGVYASNAIELIVSAR